MTTLNITNNGTNWHVAFDGVQWEEHSFIYVVFLPKIFDLDLIKLNSPETFLFWDVRHWLTETLIMTMFEIKQKVFVCEGNILEQRRLKKIWQSNATFDLRLDWELEKQTRRCKQYYWYIGKTWLYNIYWMIILPISNSLGIIMAL